MNGASPVSQRVRTAGIAISAVAFFLLLALVVQYSVLPQGMIRLIEGALELKISGKVQPAWGRFEFTVDGLQTHWDKKVKVNSGRVRVQYGVSSYSAGTVSMFLTGSDVDVELLGDWAAVASSQPTVFTELDADLVIDRSGIKEIKALRVESPTLQFRFGDASNRRVKAAHET